MKRQYNPAVTEQEFIQLGMICNQLANPRKLAIIRYLHSAKFATASVIERRCDIKQPSVSRFLKALSNDTGLLTRDKVGSSVIYQLNASVWHQVSYMIGIFTA